MAFPLSILMAQINTTAGDLAGNAALIRQVRDTAPEDTDLIVFPELAITGYPPDDLILQPFFMDKTVKTVEKLAQESRTHDFWIVLPCPWREGARIYNAAAVIGNGRIQRIVYKNRLANYGVFDEPRVFTQAPLPEPVEFKDTGVMLGILICEDMWHPPAAAHLAKQGADILIVSNSSPFETGKHAIRLDIARARVEETGLPLIYVNQTGGQDDIVFDGGSFALNTKAQRTAQLPFFEECTGLAAPSLAPQGNEGDSEALDTIYAALVTGLRDYVRKNGFPGVLIGLSGGIDSALAAVLAADALGPESVTCVMLPSPYTSNESIEDAGACAAALGISDMRKIPIDTAMRAFETILPGLADERAGGLAHENMQSRCRGLILMALSNAEGRMLLSTGNKSEMAVGYATLYGDMCGGFNVLKDVYKTMVYGLARWRNAQGEAPVIPERILTKAPTAELRPDQTDQDTLPPYDILDDILECLIEKKMGPEDIIAARRHNPETVQRVWKLLDNAEYKRRQAPPGPKITTKAFGRDRRYPVTNKFWANTYRE